MAEAKEMTPEERYQLIVRNLEEVVGGQELLEMLKAGKTPKVYWGTATTGKPHFGYFVPMYKIADFLQAGCEVTILLADIHGFLDNMKSTWELLKHRTVYYKFIITEMLKLLGVPLEKLKFVQGSDYQLSEKYTLDVYKLSSIVTTLDTTRAGAEVVKQIEHPLMSSLLYPILQALDEEYLGVDIQFGGVDQRKIFMFARDFLPKIGYKKRIHLMNPLIPGLGESGKMSSSEPLSKIDFDDSDKDVKHKFHQAYSVDGQPEGNGMLAMLKYVVFPRILSQGRTFIVKRPEKWGGDIEFKTYEEVVEAFRDMKLASIDLKGAMAEEVIEMIRPLRQAIEQNIHLMQAAYPDSVNKAKQGKQQQQQQGKQQQGNQNKQGKQQQQQQQGKQKQGKQQQAADPTINNFDLRVGKIVEVQKHPDADTLYVEKVDVGEEQPRTIISGLVNWVPIEQMRERMVVVLCNLPPRPMRGITSYGMLLAASIKNEKGESTQVVLLDPPQGAKAGDRITAPNLPGTPDDELKKKKFDRVIGCLKTDADGLVVYKINDTEAIPLETSAGKITSPLKNANVS